jgi:hypothetical protein
MKYKIGQLVSWKSGSKGKMYGAIAFIEEPEKRVYAYWNSNKDKAHNYKEIHTMEYYQINHGWMLESSLTLEAPTSCKYGLI